MFLPRSIHSEGFGKKTKFSCKTPTMVSFFHRFSCKTPTMVSFFHKCAGLGRNSLLCRCWNAILLKMALAQMFSCEYWDIFATAIKKKNHYTTALTYFLKYRKFVKFQNTIFLTFDS